MFVVEPTGKNGKFLNVIVVVCSIKVACYTTHLVPYNGARDTTCQVP